MLKKIFILTLLTYQAMQANEKPIEDYSALVNKIGIYSESTDLEQFIGNHIYVTGYTMNWKHVRSFIFIDKVEYTERGEGKPTIEHSYEIKGFAIISELAHWPKEYSNKKITLSGFLKKEEIPRACPTGGRF